MPIQNPNDWIQPAQKSKQTSSYIWFNWEFNRMLRTDNNHA